MQRCHAILSHEKRFVIWEPDVYLYGSFRIGAVMELHIDSVDGQVLAGLGDIDRRSDEGCRSKWGSFSQTVIHKTLLIMRKEASVHVHAPPLHSRPSIDILADCMVHESSRGYDLNLTRCNLLLSDHSLHSLVMIHMRVRIDDCLDRIVSQCSVNQVHGRPGGLHSHHGIYDYPAGIAFDEAH